MRKIHPLKSDKDIYDAVIIGAGISGLVCGCYLAKAGMKVLIAEQHSKPGGYCTSFRRKGFTFDAAAHSFGGYREGGVVRRVFDELGVSKRIVIRRLDPSDTIISPDCEVSFWKDSRRTVKCFQEAFPDESANIEGFFLSLIEPKSASLIRTRHWTVRNLLDTHFRDERLKALLSFPLFGNGGLPPSLMSAFAGAKIFTEFLLDGGYYPERTMQDLPDALAMIFKASGGTLLCSHPVKKIETKDNKIRGVVLAASDFVPANCVVSSCDAMQTFSRLLSPSVITEDRRNLIHDMVPSLSMFVLYLGMDGHVGKSLDPGTNLWFMPHYSIEDMYLRAQRRTPENVGEFMARLSPDGKTLLAFINAAFDTCTSWHSMKESLRESLIRRIEQSISPELSSHIIYSDSATPLTLQRYTLNQKGAAYGWACTPAQFAIPGMRKPASIYGLYLTGHWTTHAQGIPGVIYLAYDTAKTILRERLRSLPLDRRDLVI